MPQFNPKKERKRSEKKFGDEQRQLTGRQRTGDTMDRRKKVT